MSNKSAFVLTGLLGLASIMAACSSDDDEIQGAGGAESGSAGRASGGATSSAGRGGSTTPRGGASNGGSTAAAGHAGHVTTGGVTTAAGAGGSAGAQAGSPSTAGKANGGAAGLGVAGKAGSGANAGTTSGAGAAGKAGGAAIAGQAGATSLAGAAGTSNAAGAGGTAGAAGNANVAGAAGGGGTTPDPITAACTQVCATQAALSCMTGLDCVAECVGIHAATDEPELYLTMMQCAAQSLTTAAGHFCSSAPLYPPATPAVPGPALYVNPTADSTCKTAICAYTCTSDVYDGDVCEACGCAAGC